MHHSEFTTGVRHQLFSETILLILIVCYYSKVQGFSYQLNGLMLSGLQKLSTWRVISLYFKQQYKKRRKPFRVLPSLIHSHTLQAKCPVGWWTQKGLFLPLSLLAFGPSFNSFPSNLLPRILSSFSLHPLLLIVDLYFSFQLSSLCKLLKFKSSLLNCIWSQASISNCLLDIPASCPQELQVQQVSNPDASPSSWYTAAC